MFKIGGNITLIFNFIILITGSYCHIIIIHIQFTILLDYKVFFTYNIFSPAQEEEEDGCFYQQDDRNHNSQ